MTPYSEPKVLPLLYLPIFLLLSYVSIQNDFENRYHFAIILCALVNYLILNLGLLLYAFNVRRPASARLWKFAFFYTIVYFLASYVIDSTMGQFRDVDTGGAIGKIVVFLLGLVLFTPAFWSSYSLAFRSSEPGEGRKPPI